MGCTARADICSAQWLECTLQATAINLFSQSRPGHLGHAAHLANTDPRTCTAGARFTISKNRRHVSPQGLCISADGVCVRALCACVVCAEQVLLLGLLAVQLHGVRDRGQGQLQHEERGLLSIVSAAMSSTSHQVGRSVSRHMCGVRSVTNMATWQRTCIVKACVDPAGVQHVAG